MRLPRSTGLVSGALVFVLGVWGALIPFVGPYFDYSFGTNSTWHYTANRLWLSILPGVLAMVAGLLLLGAATRRAGVLAGWLGLLAGLWFVVGPAVSLTWEHVGGPIGAPLGGPTTKMLELVGYFYGLGALIIACVAFASGRFLSRPAVVGEAPTTVVEEAPTTMASQSPTPRYVAPRTRRFSLRRGSAAHASSPTSRAGTSTGGAPDS
jgi:hypothetical protein